MLTLSLTLPERSDFLRRLPNDTPLPGPQVIEVEDWHSASLAYLTFCYEHDIDSCDGRIFEGEKCVAELSSNGCVWPPEEWHEGLVPYLRPTDDDWRKARGLPPETKQEMADAKARAARIREEVSWPKPESLVEGQAVLLFTTPAPINATRAQVVAVRRPKLRRDKTQYQTVSSDGLRWDNEEWVHARLGDAPPHHQLDLQTLATLRAEFAAIPVTSIGKTLGEIVNEALYFNVSNFKFEDFGKKDEAVKKLLNEMVRLATLAFSKNV